MRRENDGTNESIDNARAIANKLSLHGASKDAKDGAEAIFMLCNVVSVLLARLDKLEAEK